MSKKLVLLALISSNIVFANNLDFLVQKAINNKLVEASKSNLEASKLDYKSLKSSYLPNLHLNSSYSNTSNETASTANKGFSSSLSVNYNLYDGGRKQNSFNSKKSTISMNESNMQNLKNQIALNVITLYFNYLSLDEQKKAKAQQIKQLETQYKKQKRFFETETVAIDEVEKILSRLENENVNLQEIELNKQTILHNLEYIVGQNVSIEEGSKVQELKEYSSKLRADIKALEYEMQSAKSNAKASKSSNYPQVNVSNTYSYYDNSFNNMAYDSGVDNQNTLSVNLSWKLYDFDSTKKTYEANMKRYLALKSQLEYEKNRSNVDLKLAYKSYNISKMKIKSAKASLQSATTTFDSVEAKYQNSLVDNVAYLEALSEKYNAISILNSALYDLEVKRANIIYHSGKDLVGFIN